MRKRQCCFSAFDDQLNRGAIFPTAVTQSGGAPCKIIAPSEPK
jgi:hypothetical protein